MQWVIGQGYLVEQKNLGFGSSFYELMNCSINVSRSWTTLLYYDIGMDPSCKLMLTLIPTIMHILLAPTLYMVNHMKFSKHFNK